MELCVLAAKGKLLSVTAEAAQPDAQAVGMLSVWEPEITSPGVWEEKGGRASRVE